MGRDGDAIDFDETYDERKGKTRASDVSVQGSSRKDYGGRDSYRDRDRGSGGRDGGYHGRGRSRSRDDRGRYDRGRDDRGRDGRDRGGYGNRNNGGRHDYQSEKQSYGNSS